jgi:hypothetical protein
VTDEQPTEQLTSRLEPLPEPSGPLRARRAVPLWPTIVAALGVALLVVTIALVVSLTRQPGPAPAPLATPSATPTTDLVPAPEAAPEPAAPRPQAGPNECVDALADAGTVDLDTVTLAEEDGDLHVRFTLAGALPSGQSGVGLVLESRNGRAAHQVSIGFTDGTLDRFLVWDGDDERRLDLDGVRLESSTINAVIDGDDLPGLGNDWNWSAFGTAAGTTLDACPGTAEEPEWLRFDGRLDD